jgi:hypothetical protein
MHGLCYGVMLKNQHGTAYLPVRYSPCSPDGLQTVYGARPAVALDKTALDVVIGEVNAAVKKLKIAADQIRPQHCASLVDDGRLIGFAQETAEGILYYYHDAIGAMSLMGDSRDEVDTKTEHTPIRFPYDSRVIDEAILASRGNIGASMTSASMTSASMTSASMTSASSSASSASASAPTRTAALATAARNKHRLYRLFAAEFSAILRRDRNVELRRRISAAILETRFESPKSVAALRRRLFDLLHAYPDDIGIVREAVARAYSSGTSAPGKAAVAAIDATTFDFDRRTMAKLRSLESRAAVVVMLRELMSSHILVSDNADSGELPNMYVSCDSATSTQHGQCSGRKLIVPAERIDDFYDILAADVQNPSKTALLAAISAGVFDPLDFISRPGERLTFRVGE